MTVLTFPDIRAGRRGIVAALLPLALAACAAPELLQPLPAVPPDGIDFSGYWHMRADSADERKRINEAIGRVAGTEGELIPLPPESRSRARPPGRARSGRDSGLVRVFLESGERLKVTQTRHGLFISFDRSVVEEYRFGEDRTISVGEIEAQRVSGWDGEHYVAETLDRNGMKLTEHYALLDAGRTLERTIVLRKADGTEIRVTQLFDRVARNGQIEGGGP